MHGKNYLFDCLQNLESAVKQYRHNELVSDFKSSYGELVTTTTLARIEQGVANILTRNVFAEVKNEIEDA